MNITDMNIGQTMRLKSGYDMPALGLGTWKLRGGNCQEIVTAAIEMGYTHFDTAEAYENEQQIGDAIKWYDREKLFITSKVSPSHLNRKDLLKACSQSLKKLKTDYIDLYLIHWPNDDIPMRETFEALQSLVKKRMIRSAGVSNFDLHRIQSALTVSQVPICNLQIEYHPYTKRDDIIKLCQQEGITITAYSPLARGKVLNDEIITKIAKKYDKTPAQVTLKWLLQKGNIVIPKASSAEHLKENMRVFDWVLDQADIDKIDGIQTQQRFVDTKYT